MQKTSEPENLETLASRVQWILQEKELKQVDFAKALGISANYVYLLTSGRKTTISRLLARLIETTYGYSAEWVLTGQKAKSSRGADSGLQTATIRKVAGMDASQLRAVADFIRSLQKRDRKSPKEKSP